MLFEARAVSDTSPLILGRRSIESAPRNSAAACGSCSSPCWSGYPRKLLARHRGARLVLEAARFRRRRTGDLGPAAIPLVGARVGPLLGGVGARFSPGISFVDSLIAHGRSPAPKVRTHLSIRHAAQLHRFRAVSRSKRLGSPARLAAGGAILGPPDRPPYASGSTTHVERVPERARESIRRSGGRASRGQRHSTAGSGGEEPLSARARGRVVSSPRDLTLAAGVSNAALLSSVATS